MNLILNYKFPVYSKIDVNLISEHTCCIELRSYFYQYSQYVFFQIPFLWSMGRQAILLGYDCWFCIMAAIGTMAGRLVVLDVPNIFSLFMFSLPYYFCISFISPQMTLRRCRMLLFHISVMKRRCRKLNEMSHVVHYMG